MLKQILLRSARFNIWANQRITGVCRNLDNPSLEKHLGGSFPSIIETLIHINNAEAIWHWRLSGSHGRASLIRSYSGNIDNLAQGLIKNSEALLEYIEDTGIEKLIAPLKYRNLAGEAFEHSPEKILGHVINHSSYHRGQVINFLRQLGIESVPATDMILFHRETS